MNLNQQLSGREYVHLKYAKQGLANEEMRGQESHLFSGMVFYVNGATIPPQNEIRELVVRHGGGFVYQPSSSVTHVVATQLSNTKVLKLKLTDHVVDPKWILDCIESMTLLSTVPYELKRDAESMSLDTFVLPKEKEEAKVAELIPEETGTSKDPNFLQHYFSHSRLHHLSAWRTHFQEQLAEDLMKNNINKSSSNNNSNNNRRAPIIMHVDMDCFFASVAMRQDPSLIGRPIAVCASAFGGEVSACNYEAKKFGISGGMFVQEARKLCPELVCVNYQFDLYESTSRELFRILQKYTTTLEIVSCDEAFIDVSDYFDDPDLVAMSEDERGMAIASRIRAEIFECTGCPASIGISFNMLLARMATHKAKPNNQFLVAPKDVVSFMMPLSVKLLPGVGWKTQKQLDEMNVVTCGDLYEKSLETLQQRCGPKKGERLWMYARGICSQKIEPYKRRKSIGLDVNYGIRFDEVKEVLIFIEKLCVELVNRLGGRKGKHLTLKVMVKKPDWHEPSKFLGHGRADSHQKSTTFSRAHGDVASLVSHAKALYRQLGIAKTSDLVGIGISLGKLDDGDGAKSFVQGISVVHQDEEEFRMSQQTLSQVMAAAPPAVAPPPPEKKQVVKLKKFKQANAYVKLSADEIDPDVLDELPPDLRKEILESVSSSKKPKVEAAAAAPPPPPPPQQKALKKQLHVDPDVWKELPEDVRRDINRGIMAGDASKGVKAPLTAKPVPQSSLKQARIMKQAAPPKPAAAPPPPPVVVPGGAVRYVRVDRSQIDPNELAALPEFLREEFLAELAEAESKAAAAAAAAALEKKDHESLSKKVKVDEEVANNRLCPILGGAFEVEPFERYASWYHHVPTILDSFGLVWGNYDRAKEIVWEFIRKTIEEDHNLEDASLFLADVRRYAEKTESVVWCSLLNDVLEMTQDLTSRRYGGALTL